MRQETMKAELKLLIRNIITDQLEKWAQSKQQQEKEENPYAGGSSTKDAEDDDLLGDLQILDNLKTDDYS